jgi:preprotein translocase subunit SecG
MCIFVHNKLLSLVFGSTSKTIFVVSLSRRLLQGFFLIITVLSLCLRHHSDDSSQSAELYNLSHVFTALFVIIIIIIVVVVVVVIQFRQRLSGSSISARMFMRQKEKKMHVRDDNLFLLGNHHHVQDFCRI